MQKRLVAGSLAVAAGGFVAVRVVHGGSVKFAALFGGVLTALREWSLVALSIIVMMIDMAVEMIGAVIPGPGTNEDAA